MIENQIDFINKILKLKKENPEAEIKFCVDGDAICEWEGWTANQITRVELSNWIEVDERVYTDDDAVDEIADMLYDKSTEHLSDEEFGKLVDKFYTDNSIEAICVYITAV